MKWTGTIVATAAGSVGGCTFSRNRFGQYVRRRAMPVNPGSAFQNVMTAALASLVAAWKTLTTVQRDNWTNYALNTPRLDSSGNTIILTGQMMYVSCNSARMQIGVATINTAPTIFGDAVLTPPAAVTLLAATDVASISFVGSDLWAANVGGYLNVFISRPQSPTTNFFKGPYRFAGKINGAATPPTSPQPITSPFDYTVGQRGFIQYRALNPDGRISAIARQTILAT